MELDFTNPLSSIIPLPNVLKQGSWSHRLQSSPLAVSSTNIVRVNSASITSTILAWMHLANEGATQSASIQYHLIRIKG